uniref:Putative esterase n=1 Tax=Tribolium freemani TaxID=7072 RepID=Q5ZEX5_9CUCU|nr:putative esterase [Tribolium freemani]
MSNPIVTTEQGKLLGKICTNINGEEFCSFQGIPYAQPPVEHLRFKAPQPPKPWTGIRDALNEGNKCYSKDLLFNLPAQGSENCLFLNVYTPKNGTNLKPVMVWIHGGGFKTGSSETDLHGPEYLMTEDVVLVTLNYRLGILGFLRFEDQSLGVPGNAGLKDMVMALKWVQTNIKYFSGNPNNVTIFGESAGAAAVHYLVLSPLAKGLFHRAIAQSGCALNGFARGIPDTSKQLAAALGMQTANEKEIFEQLSIVPVDKLLRISEEVANIWGLKKVYAPVVDGEFLTDEPIAIIKSGNYNHVPMIFGYTTREGMIIEMMRKNETPGMPNDFEEFVHPTVAKRGSITSKNIAKKIKDFYYEGPNSENDLDNFYLIHTDTYFLRDIIFAIRQHTVTAKFPIYLYRMSVETKLNVFKRIGNIRAPGVCHGDDIGYLFKTKLSPELKTGSLEEISMKRFVKFWTTFARSGSPSADGPEWKPINKKEINFIDIGENITVGVNPEPERMKVWADIYNSNPLFTQ